jgi:hypothetical protein
MKMPYRPLLASEPSTWKTANFEFKGETYRVEIKERDLIDFVIRKAYRNKTKRAKIVEGCISARKVNS